MPRGELLVPEEIDRVLALKANGVSPSEIVRLSQRSRWTVYRIFNGKLTVQSVLLPKNHNNKPFQNSAAIATKYRKTRPSIATTTQFSKSVMEDAGMTPHMVQKTFIDALTPHFSTKRRGPERFLSDLTSALINEQFSAAVLTRAAQNIILNRNTSSFPSVAYCREACRTAAHAIAHEPCHPNPGPNRSESGPSPGGGRAEPLTKLAPGDAATVCEGELVA